MLYGHGDDFYNAKNEVKINFSSNVWHGANLDKLKEHLIEHFEKLTRYPEPGPIVSIGFRPCEKIVGPPV